MTLFDNSMGLYGNLTALIYVSINMFLLFMYLSVHLILCLPVTSTFIASSILLISGLFNRLSICDPLYVSSVSVYRSTSVYQSVIDCLFVYLSLIISPLPFEFLTS